MSRRAAFASLFTLSILTLIPVANASDAGATGFPLPGLGSFFAGSAPFGSLPQQASGSAYSATHSASTADTRAGKGNGSPPGKGNGELDPATPASAPKAKSGLSAKKPTGFDAKTSKEDPSKRTRTSKAFVNADGTTTVDYYSGPVNYKAADGSLQPINTTLVSTAKANGTKSRPKSSPAGVASPMTVMADAATDSSRLLETASDGAVSFASTGDDPALESVGDGTDSVSFGLLGAAPAAAVTSGSQATYPSILPGVDLQLLANDTGVKQTLVLNSASAPTTYVFPYTLSAGLTAKAVDSGVQFVDAAGSGIFVPNAIAIDSAQIPGYGQGAQSNDVAYSLVTTADGRPALQMTLDSAWLHDPSRVFPVLVDPSAGPIQSNDTATMDTSNSPMGTYSGDLKIGSYDGTHKGASFVEFTGVTAVKDLSIVGATVNLWHTYSSSCTAMEPITLYGISGNWNVSSVGSYPGVPYDTSAAIGQLSLRGGGANCGASEWDSVPLNVYGIDELHRWAVGNLSNYGFLVEGETADSSGWMRFNSYAEGGVVIPSLTVTFQNVPPQIGTTYPANAVALNTLTPELITSAHDPDNYPANAQLKYDFTVKDLVNNTVADSGSISSGDWTVPPTKLKWNKTYVWSVQVTDGVTPAYSAWSSFALSPPQPPVTSSLSQNTSGHGFSAAAGNYTTSATDASVPGVGPALQVVRDYNSLDPRTAGAFGAAWSSVFDARATEVYAPGSTTSVTSVNVTYPDGSVTGYGNNGDGTFAAPSGRYAVLKQVTGGYSLTDKDDTVYVFTQSLTGGVYGISSVTDAAGRAITFTWVNNQITTMTSAPTQRSLHLIWFTPAGASSAHVQTVVTDPVTAGGQDTLTWTYSYTKDQLTSVCTPPVNNSPACSTYVYATTASPFPAQVMDAAPVSYWRLNEQAGQTAASSVLANEGSDNLTYTGVTLGQPPSLAGSAADTVAFAGGAGSYASASKQILSVANSSASLGAWFKTTTGGGVIFYYGDQPLSNAGATQLNTPALYVGVDGRLRGCMAAATCKTAPITSVAAVTDGGWHYALLTGTGSTQTLYLDGSSVGSINAAIQNWQQPYIAIGSGVGTGWPSLSTGIDGFTGSISDVAVWTTPLTAGQATALHAAGQQTNNLLTLVKRPSGDVAAAIAYNPMSGAVSQVTDANNGVWTVPDPVVTGSSQVYRSAVLAGSPVGYWRLADASGSSFAYDEVASDGYQTEYNAVTLGQAGPFSDATVGWFDGTASSISSPGPFLDTSRSFTVSVWAKLSDTSGYHAAVVQTNTAGGYGFWLGYDHGLNAWALTTTNSATNASTWYSAAGTAGSAATGVWTHLVGTFDKTSGKLSLYVNGVLQSRQATWPAPFNVTGPLNIGMAVTDAHFAGSLSDVAIYPTALSGAQVSTLWSAYKISRPILPNASSVTPTTMVKTLTPAGTPKRINFDGTTWAASAANTWNFGVPTGASLTFQADGNLVSSYNGASLWSSNTSRNPNAVLAFQTDGNLVVYADSSKAQILWSSGTGLGVAGNYATFAPDGTFTIFKADSTPLWRFASVITTATGVVTQMSDPTSGNRAVGDVDALGGVTTYSYDTGGFLNIVTDPNGDSTTTGHDLRGNTVSKKTCQVQSSNTCSTTYYTYWPDDVTQIPPPDPRNDLITSYRDPRSSSPSDPTYLTSYTYDSAGNATSVTTPPVPGFPNGRTTTTTYTTAQTAAADTGHTPPGLPVKVTTAGGIATTTAYSHLGDIASTTDAAGLVAKYAYDNLGRLASKTVVSQDFPQGLTTLYTVDGLGRIATETDPTTTDRVTSAQHTAFTTIKYDQDGNVASTIVADNNHGDATRTTTNAYNSFDQLTQVTDPANFITKYGYDLFGHRTQVVDPNNVETDYAFDAGGHQVGTTVKGYVGDPLNPGAPTNLPTESRGYDAGGRLGWVKDAMGNETTYQYTDNNLLTTVTKIDGQNGPDGQQFILQNNNYDPAGNLVSQTSDNGASTTTYIVDAASRVASQTVDPSGVNRTTTISYNPDDAVATTTLHDGVNGWNRTTTAGFDPATGRQISQTVSSVSASTPSASAVGQTGSWSLADGQSASAADASGNNLPGTLSGGVSWSTDHAGSAVFDGTSGTIGAAASPIDTSQSFTVSAWIKPNATGGVALSQKGTSSSGFILYPDHNLNAWDFGAGTTDSGWNFDQAVGPAPVLGAWTYVTGVYDASAKTISLYINGSRVATANHTTGFNASRGLLIGAYQNGGSLSSYFDGSISQVRTYGRALSPTEVNGLYVGDPSQGVPQNGLSGQWNLTDGNVGTAADASGNNHPGTLTGGVSWSTDHSGAAVFNGGTGAITTSGPVVQDTTGSFSVAAWVDLASSGGYATAVGQDGQKDSGFLLQYDLADNRWRLSRPQTDTTNPTTTNVLSTTAPTLHAWTHLVGTYDKPTGTMTLYVNGAKQGSTVASAVTSASGAFTVGRGQWNGAATNFFPGEISGVQTYNKVLSAGDVTSLYGTGALSSQVTTTTTKLVLNDRGLPQTMTDPNQNVTQYTYDEAGHKAVITAPAVNTEVNGTVTLMHPISYIGYDTFGETVETQDADGHKVTTGYDADGHPDSVQQPDYVTPDTGTLIHAVSSRSYDGAGNVLTSTDALGNQSTYTYDQLNRVATATAPDRGMTHFTYDSNGETLSVTDGANAPIDATWDFLGHKSTSTAVENQPGPAYYKTTYNYDTHGRLASVLTPAGVNTTYGYDHIGELTSSTDGANNTTTYKYDFMGDRQLTILADGTSTEVDYNALQQPITTINRDPLGQTLTTTSAVYDGMGHVLSATDANSSTTTFTYDADGHLATETQPTTATTSINTAFAYDAAGNQTSYKDGNGAKWITTYNTWNLPEDSIEPTTATYTSLADSQTQASYDADGRPVTQQLPGGVTITASYGAAGDLKSQSATGAEASTATRAFTYDNDGRIKTAATTAAGSQAATSETFGYDDRGLLTSAGGSAGSSAFGYTPDGNMASRTDVSGATTYIYDTAGRLQTVNDAASGNAMTYGYNNIDQVNTITYATGSPGTAGDTRTLQYYYSHLLHTDTLTTASGGNIASLTYGYDLNGNLTSKTTAGFTASATNTYTYDLANRLTSWISGGNTVAYNYDNNSNRKQAGSKTFTYDARDQLISDGTTTYSYTARGTQSHGAAGVTAAFDGYGQNTTTGSQAYTYDALGRMVSDATSGGGTRSFSYSGPTNLLASDGANLYSRGPAGNLTGIGTAGQSTGSGLSAWTDIHTDVVADFTATGAAIAGSAAYDPLGNPLGTRTLTGSLGYQSEFTEGATGNVNMAARWYNPATGQFTSRDTVANSPVPNSANANPYAYANEQPLTGTDPTGHMLPGGEGGGVSNGASGPINNQAAVDQAYAAAKAANEAAVDDAIDNHCRSGGCRSRVIYEAQHSPLYLHDLRTRYDDAQASHKHYAEAAEAAAASDASYHYCDGCDHTYTPYQSDIHFCDGCGGRDYAPHYCDGCDPAGGVRPATPSGFCDGCNRWTDTVRVTDDGRVWVAGEPIPTNGELLARKGPLYGGGPNAFTWWVDDLCLGLHTRTDAEEGFCTIAFEQGWDKLKRPKMTTGQTFMALLDLGLTFAPFVGGEAGLADAGAGVDTAAGADAAAAADESSLTDVCACLCSFDPSTPVLMADGTTKPIGKITAGDEVEAADPATGKDAGSRAVQHTWINHDTDLLDVTVEDGHGHRNTLHTTANHPFYDDTTKTFVRADHLAPGHRLASTAGYRPIVLAVALVAGAADRDNLTVEQLHTYYVVAGDTPVLVHNASGDPIPLPDPGPGRMYLWRGVTANELTDISANRAWNSPQGIKYFSFTEQGASEYSRRAYAAYPQEGPYTMIRTSVKISDLPEAARMAYTADVVDGGVALNNDELKILGRPSIMTGMTVGCG